MLRLALLLGKLVRFLRRRHSGRSAGALVLALCPDFYSRLSVGGKILMVTGSVGKSSVAAAAVHMLRAAGLRVVSNCESRGLRTGTAAALVSAADCKGRISCDWLVLEADGRISDAVLSLGKPEILLVTDLFPHHGPASCRSSALKSLIERAAGPDTRLILNALDPGMTNILPALRHIRYGAAPKAGVHSAINLVGTRSLCPRCGEKLSYSSVFHHHLGQYRCAACGTQMPPADYLLTDADMTSPVFAVNGVSFRTDLAAPHHYLNLTAATALVCEALNLPVEKAAELCADYHLDPAFYCETQLDGRRIVSLLCRSGNPISFDRGLEYVAARPETKTVLLYTEAAPPPMSADISWLYDTTFELLFKTAETVVCAGDGRLDTAARLHYTGIKRENILVCHDDSQLPAMLGATRGTLYILTGPIAAERIRRLLQKGGRP